MSKRKSYLLPRLFTRGSRGRWTASAARVCTLGAATLSDGLHGGVPAAAASPYASEHIGTHGLFVGQKSSQLGEPPTPQATRRGSTWTFKGDSPLPFLDLFLFLGFSGVYVRLCSLGWRRRGIYRRGWRRGRCSAGCRRGTSLCKSVISEQSTKPEHISTISRTVRDAFVLRGVGANRT